MYRVNSDTGGRFPLVLMSKNLKSHKLFTHMCCGDKKGGQLRHKCGRYWAELKQPNNTSAYHPRKVNTTSHACESPLQPSPKYSTGKDIKDKAASII